MFLSSNMTVPATEHLQLKTEEDSMKVPVLAFGMDAILSEGFCSRARVGGRAHSPSWLSDDTESARSESASPPSWSPPALLPSLHPLLHFFLSDRATCSECPDDKSESGQKTSVTLF